MVRMFPASLNLFAFAVLVSMAIGCSQTLTQEGHDSGPLTSLSKAYLKATQGLNRPPKSPDELAKFLDPGVSVESLLKSPADGQPYVILWGTDARTGMELKPLVVGYEAQGKNGNRFVFTAMGVMFMSNEDFKTANFPPGHKP